MIQPDKGSKRTTVATSLYDQLFDSTPTEPTIDFNFELPEVGQPARGIPEISFIPFDGETLDEYANTGVRYVPGMDVRSVLENKQDTSNKVFNMLFRGVVGAGIAAIEPAAYVLDFQNHARALMGAERDYDNFFAKFLRDQEESLREAFPIYTTDEKPEMFSADWFLANGDQVIRSIGYLAPGALAYKGAGIATKALLGKAASKLGKEVGKYAVAGTAALTSGAIMNYSEHALESARFIEDNFEQLTQKYVEQGMDPGEASEKARTFLNREAENIIGVGRNNIMWNTISQANLFRGVTHSRRMKDLAADPSVAKTIGNFAKKAGIEMPTEYLEEVTTGYARVQSQKAVDVELGSRKPDTRPWYDQYADHATSYDGRTEGALGALGGGAMVGATNIKRSKQTIDALERLKENETDLGASGEKVEELTNAQLREHAVMNALKGTSENFITILENYRDTPETEAFSEDLNFEKNYKERGQKYIDEALKIEDIINDELVNLSTASFEEAMILINNRINSEFNASNASEYKARVDELIAENKKFFNDFATEKVDGLTADQQFQISDIETDLSGLLSAIEQTRTNIQNLTDSKEQRDPVSNETLEGEMQNLNELLSLFDITQAKYNKLIKDIAEENETAEDKVKKQAEEKETNSRLKNSLEFLKSRLNLSKVRRKIADATYNRYKENPESLSSDAEVNEVDNANKEIEEQENRNNDKNLKNQFDTEVAEQEINKVADKIEKEGEQQLTLDFEPTQELSEEEVMGGQPLTPATLNAMLEKESNKPNKLNPSESQFFEGTDVEVSPGLEATKQRALSLSNRIKLDPTLNKYVLQSMPKVEGDVSSSRQIQLERTTEKIKQVYGDPYTGSPNNVALQWGNSVDEFFNNKFAQKETVKDQPGLLSDNAIKQLDGIAEKLLASFPKGTQIISQIKVARVLDNVTGIGGAVDLLVLKPDGTVDIIDVKASRYKLYDGTTPDIIKVAEYTRQQTLYQNFLETQKFKVNSISILPINLTKIENDIIQEVRQEPLLELKYTQAVVDDVFNPETIYTLPVFDGEINNGKDNIDDAFGRNDLNTVENEDSGLFDPLSAEPKGQKLFKSSQAIKFLSIPGAEFDAVDFDGNPITKFLSTSNKKTEQSKNIESTKALQAGSAVELKLIDSSGNPYTIDELKALTDDQIKDARVGIYQNGEYKADLRERSWVGQKGQRDTYANTSDSTGEREVKKAERIRISLARAGGQIETTVEYKGTGKILPLYAENEDGSLVVDKSKAALIKRTDVKVKEAIPDFANKTLLVTKQGELFEGYKVPYKGNIMSMERGALGTGRVAVALETSNNQIFPAILFADNITATQASTIIGAAISYQNNNTDTYNQITSKTGILFGRGASERALSEFVNRYVHSKSDYYKYKKAVEDNLEEGSIGVYTPGGGVNILQIVDFDNRVLYTNDINIFEKDPAKFKETNIRPENIKYLGDPNNAREAAELLQRKLISVESGKMNKPEKFVDVKLGLDGSYQGFAEYKNYNDFKAEQLFSDINGQNFIEDEAGRKEYTYTTQPAVLINTDNLLEAERAANEVVDADDIIDDDFELLPVLEGEEDVNFEAEDLSISEGAETAMEEDLRLFHFDTSIISLQQQTEAMNTLFGLYAKNYLNGKSFKDSSRNIKAILNKIITTKGISKKKREKIQHLLDNYDAKANQVTVEGEILRKLKKLDISKESKKSFIPKELTAEELDNLMAEMLDESGFRSEDYVQTVYDKPFYLTDRKKTASATIKLFLSSISLGNRSWLGTPKYNIKQALPYAEVYQSLKSALQDVPGNFDDLRENLRQRKFGKLYEDVLDRLDKFSSKKDISFRKKFVLAMSGMKTNFSLMNINQSTLGTQAAVIESSNYGALRNIRTKWFSNLVNNASGYKLVKTIQFEGKEVTIIDDKKREDLFKRYKKDYKTYKDKKQLRSDAFVKIVEKTLFNMGIKVPFEGLKYLASDKATAVDISTYLGGGASWLLAVDPTPKVNSTAFMDRLFSSFRNDEATDAEKWLKILQKGTKDLSAEEQILTEEFYKNQLEIAKSGTFAAINNPIESSTKGKYEKKVITGLANLTLDFKGVTHGDSFRNANNNIVTPHSDAIYMDDILMSFKQNPIILENLLKLSYNKNSKWGRKINQQGYIELRVFEATRLNGTVVERKDQQRYLQNITMMNQFFNNGKQVGEFFPLTLADSDTTPVLRVRVRGANDPNFIEGVTIEDGKVTGLEGKGLEQIVGYAMDEYNRIKNHKQIPGKDRGPYEEGARYFYLFDYLNDYDNSQDVKVVNMDYLTAKEYIKERVRENIIQEINEHLDELETLGIGYKDIDGAYINSENPGIRRSYKNRKDRFAAAIADYNLHYIVNYNEQTKLFANDPAHAFKKVDRERNPNATLKDDIFSTLANWDKRNKRMLAPKSSPEYDRKTMTVATVMDAEAISSMTGKKIDITDAQEYGTIEELAHDKLAHGKVPSRVIDGILKAHRAAKADPNNPNNYFSYNDIVIEEEVVVEKNGRKVKEIVPRKLTNKELDTYKVALMSDKPVYRDKDIDLETDSDNGMFRKSSIKYLWPDEAVANGLEDIRVAMETTGIDRLGHKSSDKLGRVNMGSIYITDENSDRYGKTKPRSEIIKVLEESKRTVSRKGLGMQQEKGAYTGRISQSTQLTAQMFEGIEDLTLSTGETIKDARQSLEDVMGEIAELGAKELRDRLGIVQLDENSYDIPNLKELQKVLMDEALTRNWEDKDILDLKLEKVDGKSVFRMPLLFNNSREQVEQIILSLMKKNIIDLKLPGFSTYQTAMAGYELKAPDAGQPNFTTLTEYADYIKTLPDAQRKNLRPQNGITYMPASIVGEDNLFDPSKGLQHVRIVKKDGKDVVLPSQVLIHPVVKYKGKEIDLTSRKFTSTKSGAFRELLDGVVPKDFLEHVLYRLPGQGRVSATPTIVVGFLPKTSYGTTVVAPELAQQMGSDQDGDTDYHYTPFTEFNEATNKIELSKNLSPMDKLRKEFFDITKKVMFDPKVAKLQLEEVLDNDDLQDIVKEVEKRKGTESKILSPSYVRSNIKNFSGQVQGKRIIGPSSLTSVFGAAMEGRNILLNPSKFNSDEAIPFSMFKLDGDVVELISISASGDGTFSAVAGQNRTAAYNNRTLQSASVDNANLEGLIYRAGVTNVTFSAALLMSRYVDRNGKNLPLDIITPFLSQEALEIYNDKYEIVYKDNRYKGKLEIRKETYRETMKELANRAGFKLEPNYSTNLSQYKQDALEVPYAFSSQDLLDMLEQDKTAEYYKKQQAVLVGYMELDARADVTFKIQQATMAPRTNGLGKDMFQAQQALANMEQVFSGRLRGAINLDTGLDKSQYKKTYMALKKIYNSLKGVLPFEVPVHQELLSLWEGYSGAKEISPTMRRSLHNAMLNKSYTVAYEQTFDTTAREDRIRLLYSFKNAEGEYTNKSLARRIEEIQETDYGKTNMFISRLLAFESGMQGYPSYISWSAAKQQESSSEAHDAFVDLYKSKEPGHRELFEDLVKYVYLTGAVQSSKNFPMFLNSAYANHIGLTANLREQEANLLSPETATVDATQIFKEWIQHNPRYAREVEEKDLNKISASPMRYEMFGGTNQAFEIRLKRPNNPNIAEEVLKYTYQVENSVGDLRLEYLPILQITDNRTNNYNLFEFIANDPETGDALFRRIGLRGGFIGAKNNAYISEFSGLPRRNEDGGFVIEESVIPGNTVPIITKLQPSVPQTSKEESVEDGLTYGFDPVEDSYYTQGREGVKKLINRLKDSKNPANAALADLYSKALDTERGDGIQSIATIKTVNREGKDIEVKGAYNYKSKIININTDYLSDTAELEETVLHEYTHGFLHTELNNNPDGDLSRRLGYLRKQAAAAYKKDKSDKTNLLEQKLNIALESDSEFASFAMSDSQVQEYLNNIQAKPDKKNVLQKFKDLVLNLIKSIGKALGIEITEGSILEQTVGAVTSFVTDVNKSEVFEKVAEEAERAAGEVPWSIYTHELIHRQAATAKGMTERQIEEALEDYRNRKANSQDIQPSFVLKSQSTVKDKITDSLEERARTLRKKITPRLLKTSRGKKIQERLDVLYKQINQLKRSTGRAQLEQILSLQEGFVAGVLRNPNATYQDLQEALNVVDSLDYNVTKKYLTPDQLKGDNTWNIFLLERGKKASELKAQAIDKATDILYKDVKTTLPVEEIEREDLSQMEKQNYVSSLALDLSKFKNPVVRTLDSTLKTALRNAETREKVAFARINAEIASVQKYLKEDPNIFFQKDEKGNLSGNVISRYSTKFERAKADIFRKYFKRVKGAKLKDSSKDIQAKALLQQLNQIEVALDVRWFIEGPEFSSAFKSKEEYLEYLDVNLGVDQRKEMVAKALSNYEKYKERRDEKFTDIVLETIDEQDQVDREEAWEEKNSPIQHLNARYGKSRISHKNRGFEYIVAAPSLKNEEYYNKEYKKIEKDPKLKSFLDSYITLMKEFLEYLPKDAAGVRPDNFFPFVRRGFVEKIMEEGTEAILSYIKDSSLSDLYSLDTVEELEPQLVAKGSRDPLTGKVVKSIPVRMLRGPADQKSYDIGKVMKQFASMAIKYEFKSAAEDKVLLLQRLVREARQVERDASGNIFRVKSKYNNKLTTEGGLKNTTAAIDHAIEKLLYTEDPDIGVKNPFITRGKELLKQFEALEEKRKLGKIDDSKYFAEKENLKEEYKKLNIRPASGKKFFKNLMTYTQLKGMGWNVVSGINNVLFGTSSNYIHAQGKEDFDTEQLSKGYATLATDGVKAAKLSVKFNILFEHMDIVYKGSRKSFKFSNLLLNPFEMQHRTEMANQIAPMVALMFNTKVADGVTLWDAYDENGNFKNEYKKYEEDWSQDLDAFTENKFTKFRDRIIEINKNNHGNYDPNSVLLLNKTTVGQMMIQFRRWMLEQFNVRFGGKLWNKQLGRYTKGRYRILGDIGVKNSAEIILKNILQTLTFGAFGGTDQDLRNLAGDDFSYTQMKKNLLELKLYIAFQGMKVLLKNLKDDEDEDSFLAKMYQFMLNTFFRLSQDTEFYVNPNTFQDITRNIFPVQKTVTDVFKAADATVDYVMNKEEYEASRRDPVLWKWAGTVPFGNSLKSGHYMMTEEIER